MCDSSGTRLRHSPPVPAVVNCKVTQLEPRKENSRIKDRARARARARSGQRTKDTPSLYSISRIKLKFEDLARKLVILFSFSKEFSRTPTPRSLRNARIRPIRWRNIPLDGAKHNLRDSSRVNAPGNFPPFLIEFGPIRFPGGAFAHGISSFVYLAPLNAHRGR